MDHFGVPTSVNRHVLRAVNFLTNIENFPAALPDDIEAQVKYTMRYLKPIDDVENVIKQSVETLAGIGFLKK
ncbi:hypothetical protein KR200_006635, partial [Drosophila serrata]